MSGGELDAQKPLWSEDRLDKYFDCRGCCPPKKVQFVKDIVAEGYFFERIQN